MARIRAIKPEFWQDYRMTRLPALSRLVYICLWSMADDEGRIEGDADSVWRFGGFREDSRIVASALDELRNISRVVLYEVDGTKYIHLPLFVKHQKIDHPKPSKLPRPHCTYGDSRMIANDREDSLPGARTRDVIPDPIPDPDTERGTGGKPSRRFEKPTLEDVAAYCRERKNQVDPQAFMSHYESNGWRVGRNPMKDWKAAVRTWEQNSFDQQKPRRQATPIGAAPPTEYLTFERDTGGAA